MRDQSLHSPDTCQGYPSVPDIQSSGKAHVGNSVNICGQNKFLPIEFNVYLDVMCTDFQGVLEEVLCGVLGGGETKIV